MTDKNCESCGGSGWHTPPPEYNQAPPLACHCNDLGFYGPPALAIVIVVCIISFLAYSLYV